MALVKLIPLDKFVCNQYTVTIIQTPTEILVAELDPSIATQCDTFPLIQPLLDELDSWMAYFVNIGKLKTGYPMDRLAFTELLVKSDGVVSEPTPRECWWVQITVHDTIFPLEVLPVHHWMTEPKYRDALLSIYHKLAVSSKAGVN